ncbi:MAG: helix-turn-helix domain-containing protein [Leptospirillum sp.]|nr:hypothetical protein [Nitrospiraceae bacterium]
MNGGNGSGEGCSLPGPHSVRVTLHSRSERLMGELDAVLDRFGIRAGRFFEDYRPMDDFPGIDLLVMDLDSLSERDRRGIRHPLILSGEASELPHKLHLFLDRLRWEDGRGEAFDHLVRRKVRDFMVRSSGRGAPGGLGIFAFFRSMMEEILVSEAMAISRGNQVRGAKLLGISRTTLREKLRQSEGPESGVL